MLREIGVAIGMPGCQEGQRPLCVLVRWLVPEIGQQQAGDNSTGVSRKSAADCADRCPVLNCGVSVSRSRLRNSSARKSVSYGSVKAICYALFLARLVKYESDLRQIQRGHYTVSIQQAMALTSLCEMQGYEVPEILSIEPASPQAVLLHWRVLLVVFSCLYDQDRHELIDCYPINSEWINDTLPEAIDSHFHMEGVPFYTKVTRSFC